MRRSICELTKPSARRELRLAGISTFTTADVPSRVLTAAPRIKPTSTRCHSAWQPKPGRGSTYRRGDFVQTSGTSLFFDHSAALPNRILELRQRISHPDRCLKVDQNRSSQLSPKQFLGLRP